MHVSQYNIIFEPVKFLSVILTLYLALLTAVPCADSIPGHQAGMEQTGHHDHEGEPDGCSPLCCCNCCQIPFVLHSLYTFQEIRIVEILGENRQIQVPESPVIPLFRPPQV